jgi:hypothetical protein
MTHDLLINVEPTRNREFGQIADGEIAPSLNHIENFPVTGFEVLISCTQSSYFVFEPVGGWR